MKVDDAADIEERTEDIIENILLVDRSSFDDSTSLGPEGIDVDSLTMVEMAETFTMEFGVEIPDEALEEIETVGDIKQYVTEKAGNN